MIRQGIIYLLLLYGVGFFDLNSILAEGLVIEPPASHSTIYYVAADGNDTNSGTAPDQAWQSIAHLNAKRNFGPGDQILFRGGDTFPGGLVITLTGTSNSPCRLGSYGSGSATLTNVAAYGGQFPGTLIPLAHEQSNTVKIFNSQYFTVEDLNFSTAQASNYPGTNFIPKDTSFGLYLTSTTHSGNKYHSVLVHGCSFKNSRIGLAMVVDQDATTDGYDDVQVTNCVFDSTYCVGCFIVGYHFLKNGPVDQLSHIYVGCNQFYRIYGDPNEPSEAQPLYVGSATGIVIERNLFGNNCGYGGALKGTTVGGSTAFSVSNCRNFQMQYNEVYGTKCVDQYDGSAIDVDQDSQNGEVCYNLTYENDGPSIQLGSFGGSTTRNIAIHHNISYNDVRGCRTNSVQGAIRLWGHLDQIQIFNNSIYVSQSGCIGVPSCLSFEVGANDNVSVLNNIFKTTDGIAMVRPNGTAGTDYNSNHISSACKFIGNCYDSTGGALTISTDDTHGHYTNITTLAAWRAAGQETWNSKMCGVAGDAGWTGLMSFEPAAGFLPLTQVSALHNFDLSRGSICRGKGVDPGSFITLLPPLAVPRADYHGSLAPVTSVGAVDAADLN